MSDRIEIRGLELMVHIGVPDEERAESQRVLADISLVPTAGLKGLDDAIEQTIDYDAASQKVMALAAARPRKLLETLAEEILELLRESYPLEGAQVRLRKFILPHTEHVAVVLEWRQSD